MRENKPHLVWDRKMISILITEWARARKGKRSTAVTRALNNWVEECNKTLSEHIPLFSSRDVYAKAYRMGLVHNAVPLPEVDDLPLPERERRKVLTVHKMTHSGYSVPIHLPYVALLDPLKIGAASKKLLQRYEADMM